MKATLRPCSFSKVACCKILLTLEHFENSLLSSSFANLRAGDTLMNSYRSQCDKPTVGMRCLVIQCGSNRPSTPSPSAAPLLLYHTDALKTKPSGFWSSNAWPSTGIKMLTKKARCQGHALHALLSGVRTQFPRVLWGTCNYRGKQNPFLVRHGLWLLSLNEKYQCGQGNEGHRIQFLILYWIPT